MILRLLIRPRHLTDEGLVALRDVLAEHPGEDEVQIALYSQTFRLPVRVNCAERSLRSKVAAALGGVSCAIIIGLEPAF